MLMAPVLRAWLVCVLLMGGVLGTGAPAVAATGSGGALAGDATDAEPGGGQHVHAAAGSASGGAPDMSDARTAPAQPIVLANLPFRALIGATARRHGVPASLLTALVWQESGFRANARSKAGARGLTQLMPGTARDLGVRRIDDPAENLDGGARYLKALLIRFGSSPLALAAYNAGPHAVVRHGGIPPYEETRRYVRSVLSFAARLRVSGAR